MRGSKVQGRFKIDFENKSMEEGMVDELRDPNFEGMIPAGTPMAQIIPFKRDSWEMSIGKQQDLLEQNKITTKLRTKFFDSYKTQYRQLKEYK